MRIWWVILVVVACKKQQEPAGSGAVQVAAVPADAQPIDMATPDAAPERVGPAPVDSDKLLDLEAVGPLTFGMTEAAAVKTLGGPPSRKTLPEEEGATGEFVSTWTWKDVTLVMASPTRTGAAKVRLITVTGMPYYATKRGIKVGSTRAEVAAAYPKSDEGGDDPTQFLVGSPYGGLLFVLKNDVVAEIVLGPMAE